MMHTQLLREFICYLCNRNKNRFIEEKESKGLLSSLRLKTLSENLNIW